ncbi:hypothetical protein [Dinghuibacter silviterrae]|uniref:Lipoprotein n=1 Tax=Dinghuibacter silviterrae TaxID=1539049 RepID=A0A4R8DI97_9BACT|nr:hypothetical protein [Dinghuibacter silviterrae]TDW97014.1 hypothetical protein EDB95_4851 [Dinghuibacter silviterrae]
MRIRPVYLLLALGLSACHRTPSAFDTQKLLGTYGGNMGKGVLSLTLNYINGDIVSGFDIHQGARRNVNGHLQAEGDHFAFTLNEPGDHPNDGIFSFTFDTAKLRITGDWKPQHPEKASEQKIRLHFVVALDSPYSSNSISGTWNVGADSLLVFNDDGYCEYNFYKHAEDSTSQVNTVRGNYVKTGNTIRIDWEKNPFTPARQMTLKVVMQPMGDPGDSVRQLKGNGWVLEEMMD